MDQQRLLAIASRFALGAPVETVEPLGSGNINDTYLVHASNGARGVLQRINTQVFPRPDLVMANLGVLSTHAAARQARLGRLPGDGRWELPRLIPCSSPGGAANDASDAPAGSSWLEDQGEAWRMLSFVADSCCYDTVQSLDHAREVGRALGRFHRLIDDLPPERLADTLEGFHMTPRYLAEYQRVLASSQVPRCPESDHCRLFVDERLDLVPVLERARERGRLRLRPIHGDPKVNNVLLCSSTGCAVALVDLDTVKPGLLHYDIGDCLRSGCNPAGEETTDLAAVRFDLAICRSMLEGYLAEARSCLSAADLEHLYDAIRLLPFELGLRFFTDHLAGNVYFKVRHGRHNLERALVQFRLTESIEAQEGAIRSLIEELS
ncbi:phosphotransferase enzyme family protein [Synechococcus sp. GFB01]|uniref:phosphotransferase enzyme family protein n=1 Tax=Synechococcus sp. GFB01 TaxID=1662190 RepID=UPI00064FE153|nr:aminoglycoside phosphotransferase family protein [Synechococcus sp. GFB01]KMM17567.1 aminoglycoside phosphotransferase [Synechococcus sp. GFB01]